MYAVRRLLLFPLTLLVVVTLIFVALRAGAFDPASLLTESVQDPAVAAQLREQLGLDRPAHEQYVDYLADLVRGDLGRSYQDNRPVADVILERGGATIELAVFAMIFGTALGLVLGCAAAVVRNGVLHLALRSIGLLGISVPGFTIGIGLIIVFSVDLGWLPVGGRFDARLTVDTITGAYVVDALLHGDLHMLGEALRHLVLPVITIGVFIAGFVARVTEASVREALLQDHVRTARAKGAGEVRVVLRHALRSVALPVLTVAGLQFGNILGGAVVAETVFSWPGLGNLLVEAISRQDFPQIQASVMVLAFLYLVTNLLVDLSYGLVDPRVRGFERGAAAAAGR